MCSLQTYLLPSSEGEKVFSSHNVNINLVYSMYASAILNALKLVCRAVQATAIKISKDRWGGPITTASKKYGPLDPLVWGPLCL